MSKIEIINSTEDAERLITTTYFLNKEGCTTEDALRQSNNTDKVKEVLDNMLESKEYDEFSHANVTIKVNSENKSLFNDKTVLTLNIAELYNIYEKYDIYKEEDKEILDELLDKLLEVAPYIFSSVK